MNFQEYQKKKEHLNVVNEIIKEYGDYRSLWSIKSQLEACIEAGKKNFENITIRKIANG